ncbi:hypothetical protein SAMN05660293_03131 [Dyadobacter psychrophilus]|uniref:Uncharacterized protein n=1 Tax=Dyadobacter psychrophilus TaxID=651661 RepID=A0A1T5FF51_9BACT|nr:hypothetical protein SAMN05660293_03131 [Dyadobacter psychrophilus]
MNIAYLFPQTEYNCSESRVSNGKILAPHAYPPNSSVLWNSFFIPEVSTRYMFSSNLQLPQFH